MSDNRRIGPIEVAIGALCLLLIGALAFLAVIASHPRAAGRLVLPLLVKSPRALSLASDAKVVTSNVIGRAADGYAYRVERPVDRILHSGEPGSSETTGANGQSGTLLSASECTSCHPGYRPKIRHSTVYFEHTVHDGEEFQCERCHDPSEDARCDVPVMAGCSSCHAMTSKDKCATCHPPGSLFHGATSAANREIAQECVVCHPNGEPVSEPHTHEMPVLSSRKSDCDACHEKDLCDRCHPADHSSGYSGTHYADLSVRSRTISECWRCHDARWCGAACHANNAARRAR